MQRATVAGVTAMRVRQSDNTRRRKKTSAVWRERCGCDRRKEEEAEVSQLGDVVLHDSSNHIRVHAAAA